MVFMTKQTARNNKFLAGVKRMMNHKIYPIVARKLNAEGQDAALAYLKTWFNNPDAVTVEFFVKFEGFGGDQ